ncbi:MAG TPA: hypothetical protein VET30_04480 [Pseudoxanthomonas sp.]|nr:hypothetical protein [Pseudoxanthomonas sp.]
MKGVTLLLCCASSATLWAGEREPWSEVESDGAYASSLTDYNIEVLGMDGQMDFDRQRTIKRIKPGLHYLQIATTKPGRRGLASYQNVTLDAEACVRYYLAARHKPSLSNLEWEPVIVREKRIGGCQDAAPDAASMPAVEAG